jgi:hypothetical protein
MRFRTSALALAALVAVPGLALAQSAMSHDSMMAHDAMMSPTMATLMCRPVSDKDSHTSMMSMHETSATAADGTKLVCKSMTAMHNAMAETAAKAKKAADAGAATQIWQDFLTTGVSIPEGG